MPKRKVQLKLWVHYDSQDGYVWPQVYGSKEEAELNEKSNYPIKVMELTSAPFFRNDDRRASGSFGTEVMCAARADQS